MLNSAPAAAGASNPVATGSAAGSWVLKRFLIAPRSNALIRPSFGHIRLLNLLTMVSLLPCVAVAALWAGAAGYSLDANINVVSRVYRPYLGLSIEWTPEGGFGYV